MELSLAAVDASSTTGMFVYGERDCAIAPSRNSAATPTLPVPRGDLSRGKNKNHRLLPSLESHNTQRGLLHMQHRKP